MLTKAPRGTKDITPQDSYKWQYVENKIHDLCNRFGYKEVRTPVFEHTELFERGVGDTTDVVQKEMYTFEDKGNRSITLRPEGTAGVVRCFLENNLYANIQPTKLYYLASCYRYEKPQAGRLREFHQFGVEAFGSPAPSIDAEAISLAMGLLSELGVKELKLFVNSIGCPTCRVEYDKKLRKYFNNEIDRLCETCKTRLEKNPMRIIDCKVPLCGEIGKGAPKILSEQCETCTNHYNELKKHLDVMSISYEIDDTIVRGLDYYTTTVFEIKSEGLVISGGGRYDGLVEELGGVKTPGVGFGLGLERLLIVLENQGILPENPDNIALYIANMGEVADLTAGRMVYELRKNGVSAEKDLMKRSFKKQMIYADKIDAKFIIVLGDDEISSGVAQLKNMSTGEQTQIELSNLQNIISIINEEE